MLNVIKTPVKYELCAIICFLLIEECNGVRKIIFIITDQQLFVRMMQRHLQIDAPSLQKEKSVVMEHIVKQVYSDAS